MIDSIVAALFIIFFLHGWHKGLIRSVLGPVSLIAGSIVGYLHYQKEGDLLVALGISILGPFLLNIILHLLLKIVHHAKDDDSPKFSVGRMLGGVFCMAWGGVIVLLILALTMLMPGNFPKLNRIKEKIGESKTYQLIRGFTDNKIPSVREIEKISDVFNDPAKFEKLQTMKEFRALAKDEKVQSLLEDETLVEQIQNKEYTKVISNPKMQAILKDEALLKKFIATHTKLIAEISAENPEAGTAEADAKSAP